MHRCAPEPVAAGLIGLVGCGSASLSWRIYGGALLAEHLRQEAQVRNWIPDAGGTYRRVIPSDTALAERFAPDLAAGNFARFTYLTLSADHPEEGGRAVNEPLVRDNDFTTGLVVEALSRSPFWDETAVFVVQDDPGDLVDHVSTHRVPCLAAGGRVRPGTIDSHHYSFPSIPRSIGLILGLEPLGRHDAGATPIATPFAPGPVNPGIFQAIRPQGAGTSKTPGEPGPGSGKTP